MTAFLAKLIRLPASPRPPAAHLLQALELVRFLARARVATWTRNRLLGLWWWLLEPLALAAVYSLVVRFAFRGTYDNYPLFVLCAVIPWAWFAAATSAAGGALRGSARLLHSASVSHLLLPTAEVLAHTYRFVAGLCVLTAVAAWYGFGPSWSFAALPLVVGVQLLLTVGIGFLLALANTVVADTAHIWSVITRIWFFATPSLYSLDAVPAEMRWLLVWNPFTTLFAAYRTIFLHGSCPDLLGLLGVALVATLVLVSGALLLRQQEGRLALYV